ncbi:MAG TPA: hypothetical protein VFC63_18430 [Blastocatellia bacterium]|nr:hypothetical protein [Blastocatellia bacterium]
MTASQSRPAGITILSVFFSIGAVIGVVTCISLLFPGSILEPMWRLNPRAHENFMQMGHWAVTLMMIVGTACAIASIGLWRSARWGYWTAIALITINLIGDTVNAVLGTEPKAAIGIPIAAAILAFLFSKRVRSYFAKQSLT